jgi:hypothetical protein
LRERAVIDRRLFNRPYYLNPEDLTDYNPKWQSDCAITEQAMLVGEGFAERGL